jgi:hypothetical protein
MRSMKRSTFEMMHSEIDEIKNRTKNMQKKKVQDSGYGRIQHYQTHSSIYS